MRVFLKKHLEQYTTKYYESDNRWHSFLPDENRPRKMKPIAKRKREDLENVIVDFYLQQEQSEKRKIISEKLNKKQYYNMAVIIRQSLDYLVELGELSANPVQQF